MKKVILTQGEIEYELGLGIGSWARSIESDIIEGDTRVINDILMQAKYVYRDNWWFASLTVNWAPVDKEFGREYNNLQKWMNA